MEITKHNFLKTLPEIEACIDACDFLSIDGEFTGLMSGNAINSFDTPLECYIKYRNGSKDFLLIQFGLSVFRWDEISKSYKHRDFSFYLFPRQEVKYASEKIFSCQSSSIEFLAKHKFDFNKLFYDGLSYIDTAEETRMRERLQEKQISEKELKLSTNDNSLSKNIISVPENFQQRIMDVCEDVEKFLNSEDKKQLEFNDFNSFQRKLIYQELQLKFDKSVFIETKITNNDKRQLIITRGIDENEIRRKMEENHVKEWEDLETAVGFSVVARKISNCGKLVVGHCMILDLLHSVQNFFHPLPENYEEFKLLTSQLFSSLLDTMYMIKTNTFKEHFLSFDLSNVCATLLKKPFTTPKIESEESDGCIAYSLEDRDYHMAGFDAFITGVCLINLYEYLKTENLNKNLNFNHDKLDSNSNLLKPYFNKLFLYKTSFQGSPFINIAGKDPSPSREHVFHITFPASWTRSDISDIFESHGGLSCIAFIDETSAYVSLKQHDQGAFAKTSLCQENKEYRIMPFWNFKQQAIIMKQNIEKKLQNISRHIISTSVSSKMPNPKIHHDTEKVLKRKLSAKSSDSDQESKDSDKGDERLQAPACKEKDKKKKKRQRKTSQTSAGDFTVVSKSEKLVTKSSKIQNVFKEPDSWD